MTDDKMKVFRRLFTSGLDSLNHIIQVAEKHFPDNADAILAFRLVEDMLPFSTQVVYSCNQPHNFVLWCEGEKADNLKPELESTGEAKQLIERTRARLMEVNLQDSILTTLKRVELSGGRYFELPGSEYVNEFLIPNFYFHLVTAYDIMRMKGVPLGKEDYMLHLVPLVKQS